MKAIVRNEYGSPDVLRLEEIPTPTPADNEVLVRVLAASVNKGDWEILRVDPLWVRLAGFGLVRPKTQILGSNLAGRVEAVGRDVTQFEAGDEVFGDILQCGLGAFAEYVCVPEDAAIVRKPASITFEEAASVPEAGFIALQAIRDKGRLKRGQKILINGAGGGAGSFAVQLAKSLGAEVTGVDSTEKLDLMRSLGADHALDYTQEDFEVREPQYDFDPRCRGSPVDCHVETGTAARRNLRGGRGLNRTNSQDTPAWHMGLMDHRQDHRHARREIQQGGSVLHHRAVGIWRGGGHDRPTLPLA